MRVRLTQKGVDEMVILGPGPEDSLLVNFPAMSDDIVTLYPVEGETSEP